MNGPLSWRLMRALISTGCAIVPEWAGSTIPPTALGLILKLAGTLPLYRLPDAVLNDNALLIHWNVALDDAELSC